MSIPCQRYTVVVNLLPVKDESILFYTICKTADIAYASILLIGFVMNVH